MAERPRGLSIPTRKKETARMRFIAPSAVLTVLFVAAAIAGDLNTYWP
jgi:hypothetical protein